MSETALPATAEDRKAASALAALDSTSFEEDRADSAAAGGDNASKSSSAAAAAAIKDAVAWLEGGGKRPVGGGGSSSSGGGSSSTSTATPSTAKKAPVKNIKVDQADVALLVSRPHNPGQGGQEDTADKRQVDQLDVTKVKATEMLRAGGGDAVQTLKTYVSTPW